MAELIRVKTGPTSGLKLSEEEAKAYREQHAEAEQPAADPEVKAVEQPVENKAVAGPAEKKAARSK